MVHDYNVFGNMYMSLVEVEEYTTRFYVECSEIRLANTFKVSKESHLQNAFGPSWLC